MPLSVGTRVGPYEIVGSIGAGGMGEVYRARDTKLRREVAIKVLPQLFAADSDRLARFEREAQVLASLNHSNIAQVYGLEESNGVRALVMEFVDGPTLADLIAQRAQAAGPGSCGLPLDDALPIHACRCMGLRRGALGDGDRKAALRRPARLGRPGQRP